MLLEVRYSFSFIYKVLSRTLAKDVNTDIGLSFAGSDLFPFLKMGVTVEYFIPSGKSPVNRTLFHI
jgi:hypothetical protein